MEKKSTPTKLYTIIQTDKEDSSDIETIGIFHSRNSAKRKIMSIIKKEFDEAMDPNNTNGRHNFICNIEEGDDDRFDEFDFENDLTWDKIVAIIEDDLQSGETDGFDIYRYTIKSNRVSKK